VHQVALTVGVFDLLHEGHVNLLQEMRKRGREIHVIVHDDLSTFHNKNRFPVQPLEFRLRNLEQIDMVDRIGVCHSPDPSQSIARTLAEKDDVVYVRGDDWPDFPGRSVLETREIPIEFVKYTQGVSSTQRRDEL
jgi:cytidyltransferase-like protein